MSILSLLILFITLWPLVVLACCLLYFGERPKSMFLIGLLCILVELQHGIYFYLYCVHSVVDNPDTAGDMIWELYPILAALELFVIAIAALFICAMAYLVNLARSIAAN